MVMKMTDNEKILTQIIQITQMGQAGINSVMPRAEQPALRQALKVQRLEYQSIGAQAKNLAKAKGLNPRDSSSLAKHMSAVGSKMKLMAQDPDSKIADMMIQGSTRGVIQSLKGTHRAKHIDPEVAKIAQNLLETQHNNIRQLEGFL